MNLQEAPALIGSYLDADIPVMMWGAPGIGKSDCVRQVAAAKNMAICDFRAVLRDPVDLRGLPSIENGTAKWLPPSDLPNAERDGEIGLLFMDELNAAPASVQAACFGLVLDRKVGEYRLPEGWRIVAAGNRQSDRAAAQRMPTALANRFAHLDLEPDVDSFCAWAAENEKDPMMIAFLRYRPNLLHDMEGEDLRAFPSPRSWAQASKVMHNHELVCGLVGEGPAAELTAFLRVAKDLPSLDVILANPTGIEVPKDPAAKYAVMAGLSRKVSDEESMGAAITYMHRVGDEFEHAMVIDAVKRDQALSHTEAFTRWASDNKDVLLA